MEIATAFNGEILNCDAMQLYKGLPIITNKISVEEQKNIPHHLLGCLDLDKPTWTVGTFVPHALRKVNMAIVGIGDGTNQGRWVKSEVVVDCLS